MTRQTKLFIALALMWAAIIGGFIATKEYSLRTGIDVILTTEPVDPRDLLRGDYVILRYTISRLPRELAGPGSQRLQVGDTAYVTLSTSEAVSHATGLSASPPEDQLFIRGTVSQATPFEYEIAYGIESYFVPEGVGRILEQERGGSLSVKVSVDPSGTALIRELLLDGQPVRYTK